MIENYVFLRNGIGVYKEKKSNRVHFVFSTKSLHKIYYAEEPFMLMLKLLVNHHNIQDIYNFIQNRYGDFSYTKYINTVNDLVNDDILEYKDSSIDKFNIDEKNRYKRLIDFWGDFVTNPNIGSWSIQSSIKKATIVILGVGGLGSWLAQSLVMSGIGKLVLIDFDEVELHNLTRQTLYFTSDIGKKKIDVLSKRLKQINPNVSINTVTTKIEKKENLVPIIKNANVVINCMDYPDINQTSEWVSRVCMDLELPHIIGGGYMGHIGLIGPTIIPNKTACWNCFQLDFEEKKVKQNYQLEYLLGQRKNSGGMCSLTAIIANIQAWDALRIVGDIGTPLMANRKGEFYFDELRINWTNVIKKEYCSVCGTQTTEKHVVGGTRDESRYCE